MPLWSKKKILTKCRITVEGSDTFYNVPVVEFKALISDNKHLALEWGVPRQPIVYDMVQFFGCVV